jgi:hypothetical protein
MNGQCLELPGKQYIKVSSKHISQEEPRGAARAKLDGWTLLGFLEVR